MKNRYRIDGDDVFITVRGPNGARLETVIDREDLALVSSHPGTWGAGEFSAKKTDRARRIYIQTSLKGADGRKTILRLHRFILQLAEGQLTDHIDNNGLNNRRSNLRPATNAQNCQNKPKTVSNSSGYKGVSRSREWWEARIGCDGKNKWLGRFPTPQEAADRYDAAARSIFGPFARLNFPLIDEAKA